MWRLLLISVVVAVALGGVPRDSHLARRFEGKIVGGENANIEDHPYQLSLEVNGGHNCGASILNETTAVTAAHCVERSPSAYRVRAGSSMEGEGGQLAQVARFVRNQEPDSDCAVLFLSKPLVYGPGVQPIELISEGQEVPAGTIATVTGWGSRSPWRSSSPLQLQAVDVPIVGHKECNDAYGGDIAETMICAGLPEGGKDSCQGDSGGPMVVDGKLVGIVSWGAGCARPGIPGVYVKVSTQVDFINRARGFK